MADYKISLGTELRTNELDKQVKDYKGKINVGVNTDSIIKGINTALSGYKASPIEVGATLNTQGVTDKISSLSKKSNRKNIKVGIDPDFIGVNTKIESYEAKPLSVKVDLNWVGVAGQIKGFTTDEKIKIDAKLNDEAIDNAIKNYQAGKKIPIDIEPNFEAAESMIKGYTARNKLNVEVKLLKGSINDDVAAWNKETSLTTVILNAKIKNGALSGAIAQYQKEHPSQCKIPIDLTLGKHDELDQKLNAYKQAKEGTYIPVRLIPASKDFNKGINKPIKLGVILDSDDISKAIATYEATPVPIAAKLIPAKAKFSNEITKTPIKIEAELAPDAINNAIANPSKPFNKISLDVQLAPKDIGSINKQVKQLKPLVTEALDIDVKLNDESINSAIAKQHPSTPLNVNIKLLDDDVNKQIEAMHPTSQIKVDVKLDDDVINEKAGKKNAQANKVKVGVELDFNGVYKQIRKYQTKSKVKVDVELNEGGIEKEIQRIQTNTPIELDVKLNPNAVRNAQNQIDDLRQRLQNIENVGIGGNGSGREQDVQAVRIVRGVDDVTRAYRELLSIQNRMGSKQQAVAKLDTTKNQQEILELSNQIDTLARKYQRIHQLFSGQFSDAQIDALNRNFEKTAEKLSVIKQRALDAKSSLDKMGTSGNPADATNVSGNTRRQVDETTQAYRELMGVLNELNSKRLMLNGLDASSPQSSEKIQRLRLQIEQLENEYDNLINSFNVQGIQFTADQWNNLETVIARVGRRIDVVQAGMSDKSAIQSQTQAYKELLSISKEIGSLEINIAKLKNKGGNASQIEVLENQLRTLQSTYQQLTTTMETPLTADQWGSIYTQIAKTSEELDKLQAEFADTREQMATGIVNNFGNYDAELASLRNSFDMLADKPEAVRVKLESLKQALSELKSADGTEDIIAKNEKYINILKQVQAEVKNLEVIESGSNYKERFAAEKEAAMRRLNSLYSEGSEAAKKYGDTVAQLRNELESCGNIKGVQSVTKKINALGTEIKKTNVQTQTFGERIKTQFAKYSSYFSVASVFMYASQGLRSMFEQVKLIDSAMTELKKVTNETDASYNKFLSNAASRSKELGTTIDGLVSSTADFARLGYGFKESQGLAEVANIYAVVGDEIEGVEDATQSLVSTMAAFKDEMGDMTDSEFALGIVDKMNEVSNNFAISSGGIGEALQRSASSMAAANNTIDETIAMITAANEVAQNPEKVGNAMKTMSMRIRGAKTELEEAGESTDGMAESTASLRQEIMALSGVDIMLNETTFKSTYQIMDELSKKWENLSDIAQATIIELVAGKHQGNVFSSLMANFDTARDALETSLTASDGIGSAMKEHAKWSESLEARLNKLKAAWQSLSQTFLNSDFLKVGMDILTGFVDVLDKLIGLFGSFGTIGLSAGIYGFIKNFSTLKTLGTDVFTALTTNANDCYDAFTKWSKASDGVVSGGKKLMSSVSGVAGAIGTVVAVVGIAYNAYKNYREGLSQARQETIKASDDFLDASSSFEKAYIKYSGKTELTAEEESDLKSAINGTVDALDDKSSALQTVVNNSNDYLESLERIADEEIKAAARAAKAKRDAAKTELEEVAMGWSRLDGSEVDASIAIDSEAYKIAEELGSKYLTKTGYRARGTVYESAKLQLSSDADANDIIEYYDFLLRYQESLSDAGLESESVYNNVTSAIDKMSESIGVYIDGVYEAAKAEYLLSEDGGIPKTVEEYLKMRETILKEEDIAPLSLDTRKSIANSLDSEYGQVFDLSSAEAQARKLVGLISGYGNGTVDGINEIGTMETFLNLRTKINDNECSIGDYITQFNEIEKMTSEWSDEEKKLLNDTFGLDADAIKEQYADVYDYITGEYLNNLDTSGLTSFQIDEYKESEKKRIEDFLKSLSKTELEAVANIQTELDWDSGNFDDVLRQIEEEAALIEAITFSVDLEVEKEKLENLTTAITESLSGSGLSNESISIVEDMFGNLDGYEQSELFERTANGIRLNSEELRKLNDEYRKTNVDGLNDKIDALGDRYNQTKEELYNLTYGTDEYNQKARELSNIEDQINATERLASQYEGLASAYQTWQRAESAGSQRDMYESMLEGLENVDDEMSRGWLDDGTIEFLRLVKGDTLSAVATTKELKAAYESLDDTIQHTSYSVRDFFTVDEDGNSTNTGVYNFLDAIGQMEEEKFGGKDVVKRDKDGNIIGFDFDIVGGDEAIAEALGISEELVQIMVRAADDAGFVVSMDGTYQQLDVLKEKAAEAAKELKETLGVTNHNFFEDGSEEGILNDYTEALKVWETFKQNKNEDGTIDMSVEGAEEAYTLVSTLQSMVDKLAEPVYMELDSSQVEKDMQKPLEKLQEYETLTQTEHQLQLKGTDTSQIEASKEEILDYFEDLQTNSPEIAAELGIKGLTREEIEKKIEAGEVEIPATIDLQVETNSTLRDMVNVALYNAGLIDEEELKKRVDIEVYAEKIDTTDVEEETDNAVDEAVGSEKEANIKIIAETFGIEDVDSLKSAMSGLTDEQVKAIAEAIGKGDVEALDLAIAGMDNNVVEAIAKALGYDDVETLKASIKNMEGNKVDAEANVIGKTDVDNLNSSLDTLESKDGTKVTFTTVLKTIKETIDNGIKKSSSAGKSVANKRTGSDLKVSNVNGTAHAHGTAFKRGDWRTKKTEEALTGELGREIVVTPDNQWYTVGDAGAEFATIPRGSIVFNHKQTEELLSNGRVTSNGGRAKALVSGTAYAKGTGGIGKYHIVKETKEKTEKTEETFESGSKKSSKKDSTKTTTKGSTGSGGVGKVDSGKPVGSEQKTDTGSGSGSSSSKDKFEETIDWIEVVIDRVQRAIDQLDQKANNVYKSWSERNGALKDEIGKVGDEIEIQQKAYDRYIKEANSVGLSESYAKKVRDGTIDIEDFEGDSDEKLVEKIKEYQDWYNKALDCKDAIEELKETEASLYQQRFENVSSQYEGILGTIEHEKNMLEEYINQSETQGWLVSYEYYRALSSNEKRNIAELEKQKADMLAELQNAMESGTIKEKSEAWYEMVNAIDEVSLSLEEANTRVMEISQTAQQLKWEQFDLLQDKISSVTEEAEFLIELLSNDKLYDDNGQLTNHGMSTMGLHGQNYNTYMHQADQAAAEARRIRAEIDSGLYGGTDKYDVELEERYREMIALQQEHILAAEGEKEAIRDMVEEGINLELDALQERIDKYNEALDSQKDLYDYQNRVLEQTKEIASLEKQMAAYSGDTSEEAQQKIQKIKVDLESARKELQETEYDKYISDQQEMLDEMYLEYETILNTRLDNIDALMTDMIAEINDNSSTISSTLTTEALNVGYTLSDSMSSIWDANSDKINNVIAEYGNKLEFGQTTTNNTLSAISMNLQNMVAKLDDKANDKVESANTSSAEKSNQANATKKSASTTMTTSKNNQTSNDKSISNDTLMGIASAIYVYGGKGSGWGHNPERKKKLTAKLGAANAAKVQEYINSYGASGDLYDYWVKKSKNLDKYKYNAFKLGARKIDADQMAWTQEGAREYIVRPSDGAILTPLAKNDSVLNANASNNIWNMANSPAEFIRDNLNLGSANVPNNSNVHSNYTQHLDKVVFNLPNVKNYEELLSAMQKDKNFERLILSMSIDRVAGKSSLAKGKTIR